MADRFPLEVVRGAAFQVRFLICCGVVAAAQISKALITIPLIRQEFSLSVGASGLIVATMATLGATTGIVAGALVKRIRPSRALVAGMTAIGLANVLGATAQSETALLIARLIEGVGFFGAVLAIPSMLTLIAKPRDRDFTLAIWSAYLPAGITLMLLLGSLAAFVGWRVFWLGSGATALAFALAACFVVPRVQAPDSPSPSQLLADMRAVLDEPKCLLLAGAFFLFTCQMFSMMFALPLLLTSADASAVGRAALLSAGVLAVSTVGHFLGGALLRAGAPAWANIAAAFSVYAVCSAILYSAPLSPAATVLIAGLALGIGGLAPAALYASAPKAAPNAGSVPVAIGLLQQASNLGQFAGPIALGFWVQSLGWRNATTLVTPAALIGLVLALCIRRATSRDPGVKTARPDAQAPQVARD